MIPLVGSKCLGSARLAGSVEYSGQVGGDELVLQVHSLINDYRATNTYTFVSL